MQIVLGVECYGEVTATSNFEIICDDEDYDVIWVNGNDDGGPDFTCWEEVVPFLKNHFADIIEISAV